MYPVSSQRRYWTFGSEQEIAELRRKQNEDYIAKHAGDMTVNCFKCCFEIFTLS